jgi:putative tryptophan/tyrosine transport system substrate-binding protein
LELLHELTPSVAAVAALMDPSNASFTEAETAELLSAAGALGLQLHILNASTIREIDAAFATLQQVRAGALVVGAELFFDSRTEQVVALAAQYRMPAIYATSRFPMAGGLMSYAPVSNEIFRQSGIYAGRILKGDKPTDLPVMQPTRFDFAINLKTALALGLTVPASMLVRADEVIE